MEERYHLARMRDARDREARSRRGDLATAAGDARQLAAEAESAARRVDAASSAIAAAAAARDRLLARGTSAAALDRLDQHARRLRQVLADARGELARAQVRQGHQRAELDAARDQLTAARARREVIERHFAAWRTERRKRAERRSD